MSRQGLRAKMNASTDPNQKARISTRLDFLKSQGRGGRQPQTGVGLSIPRAPQSTLADAGRNALDQVSGMWGGSPDMAGALQNAYHTMQGQQRSPEATRAQANLDFMRQYTGYGNGGMKPGKPMAQYQAPQSQGIFDTAFNGVTNRLDAQANVGAMANAMNGNMRPMPRGGAGYNIDPGFSGALGEPIDNILSRMGLRSSTRSPGIDTNGNRINYR